MQTIPQRATDSKFIASIEGFKGNLFKLGRLIRHDWFTVSEIGHKPRDRYLFLFKARILITKVKRISDDRSVFILKDIIRLPETSLEGLDLPRTLEFQHIEPQNHPNYPVVLEAKTAEIRDNWLSIVQEHVVDTASVEDLLFDDEIRVVSQEGDEDDRGITPYGEDLIEDLPEDLLRDLPEPDETLLKKDQVVPELPDLNQASEVEPAEEDFWSPKKKVQEEPVAEDDFWAPPKKVEAVEDDFWSAKKEIKEEVVVEDDFWSSKTVETSSKRSKEVEVEEVDIWSTNKESPPLKKRSIKQSSEEHAEETSNQFTKQVSIETQNYTEQTTVVETVTNFQSSSVQEEKSSSFKRSKDEVEEDDFWSTKPTSPPPKKHAFLSQSEQSIETVTKVEESKVTSDSFEKENFLEQVEKTSAFKAEVAERKEEVESTSKKDSKQDTPANDVQTASTKSKKKTSISKLSDRKKSDSKEKDSQSVLNKSLTSGKRKDSSDTKAEETSKKSKVETDLKVQSDLEEKERQKAEEEKRKKLEEERQKELEKERQKELERDRQKKLEKEKERQKEVDKEEKKKKELEKEKEKQRKLEEERQKELEKEEEKQKKLEKESQKELEKEEEKRKEELEREKKKQKELDKEKEKQKKLDKESQKELEKEKEKQKKLEEEKKKQEELEGEKEKQKELGKEKDKQKELANEKERQKKLEKEEKEKQKKLEEKEKQEELEKERQLELEKEKEKQQELEKERQKEKERKTQLEKESKKRKELEEETEKPKAKVEKKEISREEAKMSDQRVVGIVEERAEGLGRAPNTTVCSAWKAPTPTTGRPVFTKTLVGDVVEPGDSTTFSIEVVHDQEYYVTWLKSNKPLNDKLADRVQQTDLGAKHTLKILNCLKEDSGTYIAKVTDVAGSNALSTAHLLVQEMSADERSIYLADKVPFFIVKMKPAEVIENSNLSYAVHVKGDPMPTVTFMKDGAKLHEDDRIQLHRDVDQGRYELDFSHVTRQDAGVYKCVAMNKYETAECSAMLTVQEEDTALDQLEGKGSLLQEGEKADFTWFRDGQPMDPVERFNVMFKDEEDTLALVFQNVTPDDAGIYTCVAATSCGKISCSAELTVEGSVKRMKKDPAPPSFVEPLVDTYVSKGGTAMLEVVLDGYPKPELTWLKNMMEITVKGRIKELWENDESVTLIIKNIEESDKGMYTCQATNEIGEADCSCKVSIKSGPRIKKMEREVACTIGKPLNYVIEVDGEPMPEVSWMKNGQPITDGGRISLVAGEDGRFCLKIDDMKDSDCGNYTVLATNDMGQRSENFTIQAETVPIITKELDLEVERKIQNDYTFEVRCKGVPTPVATWYKDDKELESDDNHKMTRDEQFYQLKIRKIDRKDRGVYKVVCRNAQGEAESSTTMIVRAPPLFTTPMKDNCSRPGEKALKMFVEWESNPRPTVRWFFNDKPVGEDTPDHSYKVTDDNSVLTIKVAGEHVVGTYSIKASNEYGDSVCKARFRLHCAPEIIKALEDTEFLEEEKCKFFCKVHGVPVLDIKWTKNDKKFAPDDKRIKLSKDDEDTYCISINSATVEDSALYKCVVSNVEGKVEMEAHLIVCTPPHILGSNFSEGKTYIAMHKLVLEVEASSVPIAEATWSCDGRVLDEEKDGMKFTIFDGKFYRCEFVGSDPEQTGEYKCVLKNKITSVETSGNITIIEKEARVRKPLEDLFVKEFADGTIQCQIVGDPIPNVQWFRNGKPVPVSERFEITEERGKRMHYLTFKGVEEKDKSNFTCKGVNEHGECETSCLMTVWVKPQPGELQDTSVDFGKDLVLSVVVHAVPPPIIFWFQDGNKRVENERIEYIRDEAKEVYTFKLKNVGLDDGGSYTFQASNPAGDASGESVVKIHTEKPSILDELEKQEICLEHSITYKIRCNGLPLPEVTWLNKNVLVDNDTERYEVKRLDTDLYSLTLSNVRMEDYGEIAAIATNLVGEAKSCAKLVQKKLPCKIIQDLEHITKGPEAEDVTLKVLVQASPRPTFTWTKDGDLLTDGDKYKIGFTKTSYCEGYITLTILESTSLDSGQYRLKFKNELNEVATETALIVRPERRKPRITKKPEDFSVTTMQPGIFKAKILGHPKPEVQWMKEGRIVLPTDICSTGVTADGFYYLQFKHVTMEDGGRYTVTAKNDEGSVDCDVVLTVEPPPSKPEFLQGLKPTAVIIGYPCRMEVQMGGTPKPTVTWLKDGEPVNFDGTHIREIVTDDGTVILQIDKADITDIGQYTAIAHNPMGENRSSADLDVLGHEREEGTPDSAAHFSDGLRDSCFDEGKTIRLPVCVKGGPVPDMKWYKDGKEITLDDRMFFTYDGDKSYLEIRPCVGADSGVYKCVVSNEHGEDSTECEVSIRKCFEAPAFTQGFCGQQQLPGRDAKFSVKIDGVPKPEISWYFNGKPIKPDGDKYRIRKDPDGCTLIIRDCAYSDSGEIKCVAKNREGSSEHSARLEVSDTADPHRKAEAPVFLKVIGDQELYMNYTARFKAVVTGKPLPDFEWLYEGKKVHTNSRVISERDTDGMIRLTIMHVCEADAGTYQLKVWNEHGKANCKGKLICECLSKDGKRPVGDEYQGFDKLRRTGVPIPLPETPIISALADRRATISWIPYLPAGPMPPVTYQVEMCEMPEGDYVTAKTGIRGCSVDVLGLNPKSDYRFRVRVENRFGVSEPSPYVSTYRNRLERTPVCFEPTIEDGEQKVDGPYVPLGFRIDRDERGNFYAAPRFLRLEHDTQYGMKDFSTRIKWIVYGYPTPKLKFYYKEKQLNFTKHPRYTTSQEATGETCLFIDKVSDKDVGNYNCFASNEYGESHQIITMELSEYPRVTQHLQETHMRSLTSGKITCKIAGYPPCDVKWFKDWTEVTSSIKLRPQFVAPDTYTLNFHGPAVKDSGLYSLAAVNVAGTASSTCMVHVQDDDDMNFNWTGPGRGRHVGINTKKGSLEDHYDVGDELGRGTQGVVYHCAEHYTGKNFSAKSMWGTDNIKAWMHMEFEMMNLINSCKYVTRLYDAYEGPKNMVLVEELCAGGNLMDYLTEQQYITEYDVAHYIRQILEGLDYMHDRYIAHCGLNVGDLMLTRPNGRDIKIGDLSLSRHIRLNKLHPLDYGVPEFVAPEVAKGENITEKVDMWAVGIITYILLAGSSPFRGEHDRETLTRIQKGELYFDEESFSHLSGEAKDFVGKLLQYKADMRMNVKVALNHPWIAFSQMIPHDPYMIYTDRLRSYYSKYREWYTNASCRRWYRRRPLISAFSHPSKMVYPPGECYTPTESPCRELVPVSKDDDYTIPHRDLSYEVGLIKNDSNYQCGPDTYLLQLRDPEFPVRLRQYMKIAEHRSPSYALSHRSEGFDYEEVPTVHERRRFTDIMDEQMSDERKKKMIDKYNVGLSRAGKELCSLEVPKRVTQEITSRYSIRDDVKAIKEKKAKGRYPFFREKPQTTAITPGSSITLTCLATGDPEPVIQWFRNDVILGDTRIVIGTNGGRSQFTIPKCADYDAGCYKVVARNTIGEAVHRFRLVKAEIPGLCDPPEAVNFSGNQVLLNWRIPIDDGGSHIESYHLEMRPKEEEDWVRVNDNIPYEVYLVEDLVPNSVYLFRVAAKNFMGWGEFSISALAKTGNKTLPRIPMPLEQSVMARDTKLFVMQLPGARGEIGDLLDYDREVQQVLMKDGDEGLLQFRKYTLESELFRGEFSLVLRAVRLEDQRTFACKVLLKTGRDADVIKEFDMLKSLRHERIATLYEAFNLTNVTTFITEYLGGVDVLTYISGKYEYTEQSVAVVAHQVIDALSYLNWRGLAHLDIQPDNIVLTSPRKLDVKLVDFAQCRRVDRDGTIVDVIGPLDYQAPEVVLDQKAHPNTDVWSLGVLVYVLLTGTSPFLDCDDEETIDNIRCVRFKFESLGTLVSQEATRFIMLIFKRNVTKRPTVEDLRDHKWLEESDYMARKRERSILSTGRLREYATSYNDARARKATITLDVKPLLPEKDGQIKGGQKAITQKGEPDEQ